LACVRDSTGRVVEASLGVQGPIRGVQPFAPHSDIRLQAVRIAPEWSQALLRADPAEHANGIAPYALLNPSRASRLYDRLLRTTCAREALRLLIQEVGELHEASSLRRETTLAQAAAGMIRAHRGSLALDRMARAMSISERHVRRLVHEAAGVGPRELHRILRLNRAVLEADRCASPRWARIALDAGYCDQSHMIREFLALTGHTPSELHRGRQAENQAD
jgi:AraC-like DNA-binding protein